MKKIKQNALLLGLNSIRAFCFDGTKALKLDMVEDTKGELNFIFCKQVGVAAAVLAPKYLSLETLT